MNEERVLPDDWIVMANHNAASTRTDSEVLIPAQDARLPGHLRIPQNAPGVVIFAHGSGSSRHSPRNRFVADVLDDSGLGTLLFDLLTIEEEHDRTNVFDIELLARRLGDATRWVRRETRLPVGFFGASTGAGAALWASVGMEVGAVVSRGGRPDLAGPRLESVTAPTLLIVGGEDQTVLELNRQALARLGCDRHLTVIPGATHLFEEPGTLEQVADHARDWFLRHLRGEMRRTRDQQPSTANWDVGLDRSREDAEGTTVFGSAHGPAEVLMEREEAEGIEVFDLPEKVAPPSVLEDGTPGQKSYSADQIGLDRDAGEEDRRDRSRGESGPDS